MGNLSNKTIFISGGSRGIGLAIAKRAAMDGANIALAAKTVEPHPKLEGTLFTAAKEIEEAGGQALPIVCDIRDEAAVDKAVKTCVDRFGGIDICINNASAISVTSTLDTTMKKFDLMTQVNVRGTFLVSQKCHPYLTKSDNPHIINIAPPLDMSSKWFKDHTAYTIAKYGMSLCTLGMAAEFKTDGIGVNSLWPLIEPINGTEFHGGIKARPKHLFSHNDQQTTWLSSAPEGEIKGWGGKLADTAQQSGANMNEAFSGISSYGNTVFLSGDIIQPYVLGYSGVPKVKGLKNSGNGLLGSAADNPIATQLLEDQYRDVGAIRSNPFEKDLAAIIDHAFESNEALAQALDSAPNITASFPSSSVGRQLQDIAEIISVRGTLGMGRQVFFVGMGGFDTHNNQAAGLTDLQSDYAQAIAAFFAATQELGVENDVTLFTASEFGRSLVDNGDGTDHGWGSHHFIVGGAVNGNKIYGDMPPYQTGHDFDAGNGRLIPSTSVEQYAATLGKWFGLTETELASAFPALSNFALKDLGFMGAG